MTYITSKPLINCIHHSRVVQGRVVIVPFCNCVHTIHTSFLCQFTETGHLHVIVLKESIILNLAVISNVSKQFR